MGLETVTYIDDLNELWPLIGDPRSEGDDHIRNIKKALVDTFSAITGEVTVSHTELNYVTGLSENISTSLAAKLALAGGVMTGRLDLKAGTDITAIGAIDFTAADGNIIVINGVTAIAAPVMNAGQFIIGVAAGALALTHHATNHFLNVGGANYTCEAGDVIIWFKDVDNVVRAIILPKSGLSPVSAATATLTVEGISFLPRRHISGCEISPDGTSTLPIAAGQLVLRNVGDTSHKMVNPAAINKTTAAWAVGNNNGGLSTGTIAADTWYHVYEVLRSDTGVVDVIIDPSATSPTLPTNYDFYRYIAPVRTNGSSNFTSMIQHKDYFEWGVDTTPVTTSSSTATLRTFDHLPAGIIAKGFFDVVINTSGAPSGHIAVRHWNPALGSTSINEHEAKINISVTSGDVRTNTPIEVYSNTSQQIYNQRVTGAPGYRAVIRGFAIDREGQ